MAAAGSISACELVIYNYDKDIVVSFKPLPTIPCGIWIQFAPIFCFFVDVILLFERINAAQDELRGVYIYNIV
ncbi:hypothetical protein GGR95_000693 [Sulfitobacter undariae]|uniref:Uncharacterized protein n=2 Tax=Sulfitobacter undariae TaxID=1563671 RepID=A0A7W6GZ42_9RHOB|nr:hypothetical protein [Sulfitobacter undariae]